MVSIGSLPSRKHIVHSTSRSASETEHIAW